MSGKFEWCTTSPNPYEVRGGGCGGMDQGQRGWKLHLVELGIHTEKRFRGYVKAQTVDTSPALCGLTPAHGWGLDMFIDDECERCKRAALKRGIQLPDC